MSGFPSSAGVQVYDLSTGWNVLRGSAGTIKNATAQLRITFAATAIGLDQIVSYANTVAALNTQITTAAATPGMAAYAQQQVNDATLDIVAAYNAMETAITNVIAWIKTNFPHTANGHLLYLTWKADGTVLIDPVGPATSSPLTDFLALLDALTATIN